MVKIYTLECPITNQVRYVGKTKQKLIDRWYAHCSSYRLNETKSYKNTWIKSLIKKNLKPIIKLLDITTEENWQECEQYWISQFKAWGFNLVNMTDGGEGCINGRGPLGYKHTEEAKRKISIANSGQKSKKWLKNISEGMKIPIVQYTLEGNKLKEWKSATDAGIALGDINKKKNITSCCKAQRKSAYGFIWKYKNIEVRDKEPLR